MEISDTKSTNIIFFSVLGATFFVTALTFVLMFLAAPRGWLGNTSILPTDTTENASGDKNAKIAELQKQIEQYDAILSDENLFLLINDKSLPSNYNPDGLRESVVDKSISLIADADKQFARFVSEVENNDLECIVLVGYRTYKQQDSAYKKILQGYANAGYTLENAERLTLLETDPAGTSDFETGLAVKISDSNNSTSAEMKKSELFDFAMKNMHKYGFILRYPEGKEFVTGKTFNPFVFRYVGFAGDINHAQYMYENNMTLEEYYSYIKTMRANIQYQLDSISS